MAQYSKLGNKRGWKIPKRRYRNAEKVYEGATDMQAYEGNLPANAYERDDVKEVPASIEYSALFPSVAATSYNRKTGREFIADLLEQTRGQLVLSMSRMNDREFVRAWTELNSFVMPKMTAADIQVGAQTEDSLFAKMQSQVKDEELEAATSHSSYGIEQIDEAEVVEDNTEDHPHSTFEEQMTQDTEYTTPAEGE